MNNTEKERKSPSQNNAGVDILIRTLAWVTVKKNKEREKARDAKIKYRHKQTQQNLETYLKEKQRNNKALLDVRSVNASLCSVFRHSLLVGFFAIRSFPSHKVYVKDMSDAQNIGIKKQLGTDICSYLMKAKIEKNLLFSFERIKDHKIKQQNISTKTDNQQRSIRSHIMNIEIDNLLEAQKQKFIEVSKQNGRKMKGNEQFIGQRDSLISISDINKSLLHVCVSQNQIDQQSEYLQQFIKKNNQLQQQAQNIAISIDLILKQSQKYPMINPELIQALNQIKEMLEPSPLGKSINYFE